MLGWVSFGLEKNLKNIEYYQNEMVYCVFFSFLPENTHRENDNQDHRFTEVISSESNKPKTKTKTKHGNKPKKGVYGD